jgi:RNA polymerase sigma factor (sigma-70 family)
MSEDPRMRFERLLEGTVYACAWGYARRLCEQAGGTRHDAEDLLQEALGYAWRGLPALRDEGSFKPWLLAIVRRRFLARRMRLAREREALATALPTTSIPSDADPAMAEVLEALTRLPEGPRELLSLFYLHGLSMSETAQVLELAPRAVHMRLARARKLLRATLARDHAIPRQDCAAAQRRPI